MLSSLQKQLEIFQSLSKVLEEEEEKNKTSISSIRKDLERELEKLKAERIRKYEAYAEGVTGREEYLSEKKALSEKIEKIQTRYEQLQSITTEEEAVMEDIKKVRKVLNALIEKEPARITDEPVKIYVNEFQASSIDIGIRYWVKTEDYWESRWRVLEEIKEEFDHNNIAIPFEQLDVNLIPQEKE